MQQAYRLKYRRTDDARANPECLRNNCEQMNAWSIARELEVLSQKLEDAQSRYGQLVYKSKEEDQIHALLKEEEKILETICATTARVHRLSHFVSLPGFSF